MDDDLWNRMKRLLAPLLATDDYKVVINKFLSDYNLDNQDDVNVIMKEFMDSHIETFSNSERIEMLGILEKILINDIEFDFYEFFKSSMVAIEPPRCANVLIESIKSRLISIT